MNRFLRRGALFALLLASAGLAQAQTSDLLISEYVEGSSFNKAVEIYNGTAGSVDLTTGQYRLELYSNGAASPSQSVLLTGSIAAGGVLVLCHASADAAILAECDVQSSSVINFNGDDALVLRKASGSAGTGTVVDSLGQVGTDPGSEWGTGVTSTADNTIRRKETVCVGDTTLGDAFDPATEWDGFANNTFSGLGSHTATCSSTPTISIDDVSMAEGNSGTTIFSFTVSLTAPAQAGGVSFDIATSDGTATAGSDYVARSLVEQSIAEGASSFTFDVTVNGDTDVEGNESFLVGLANVSGANEGDISGLGTIRNDDAAALTIAQIQGSGSTSAYDGTDVVTTGVVTGKRTNGFFMQAVIEDGNPATSEGIFVFTGGAPTVDVGDAVEVTGTVDEFMPSSNPMPTTELLPSNILVTGTGNALPTPIALTPEMLGPDSLPDVLEHLEGMRVSVAAGKIVAPSPGVSNSDAMTASDLNGDFEIVVAGVPRPLREAGIGLFDPYPVPPAKEATVPYFDVNQERLKVYPLVIPPGGTPRVDAGGTIEGLVGMLSYFGNSQSEPAWELLYDPASPPTIVSGTAQAVSDPTPIDVTIAGFNLLRLFNDQDDGPGPVLSAGNFDKRITKASAVICDWLKAPDILGVVEVENLATLTSLADKINSTCTSAPNYVPYLQEGNDVGGIDVGFLVSTRSMGIAQRVEVLAVEQHGKDTLQKNQDGTDSDKLLNDRPPLRIKAVVHFDNGRAYPVTVIVVHQRSLGSIDSTGSGSLGYANRSEEVRAKRGEQAQFLAGLVHDIQTGAIGGNPNEKIVMVGDFNAFDVNDGYVDVMGISTGNPAPEPEVLTWMDSPLSVANGGTPLVLGNELTADPEQRYSYIFRNITQTLDHAVVNEALIMDPGVLDVAVDHARVNADFREAHFATFAPPYSPENPPLRTSDHDPVRVTISLDKAGDASLAWTPKLVSRQGIITKLTLRNEGPDPLLGAQVRIDIDVPNRAIGSVGAPSGWRCVRVDDTNASFVCTTTKTLQPGIDQVFGASIKPAGLFNVGQEFHFHAEVTSATADTNPGNNSADLDLP